MNSCVSDKVLRLVGVPQGSILAPLLYIFYIKDMPTKNSQEILSSFYADDTAYAASEDNRKNRKVFPAYHLQNIINELEEYCSKWRISLNPNKTWCPNFFLKSENKNTPRLWLRGELIQYKKELKFLGITFDQGLTFKAHIEEIVTRCKKRLNLIKALKGKSWGAHP